MFSACLNRDPVGQTNLQYGREMTADKATKTTATIIIPKDAD